VLSLPGDPQRPVTLQVTLFTPPGSGPFPLAVVNHGATGVNVHNRGPRYRYTYSAYYFLSRGYAVALPMARGFAGSGGSRAVAGCALDRVGLANAQDLAAAIRVIAHQPGIDPGRIVVAGQSFGGWTTLALGTIAPPGVRGLVGFSPALRTSDCSSQDAAMIAGAHAFGAAAKLPSLWFYGDNDTVMPNPTWRAVFDAYSRAGGRATLVPVGRFMTDSHQMLSFPESQPIWTPRVDAFLAGVGLPAADVHPEYLPLPFPPPSHFAALDDDAAVPGLDGKGREAYREFLKRSPPRTFAISGSGGFSATNGGFDPLARVLLNCRKAGFTCRPYAVDSDVVWIPDAPLALARTVASGATAVVVFATSVNPDCSLRGVPKFAVTGPPRHGVTQVLNRSGQPHFAAGPYAACNAVTVPGVVVTYTPAAGFSGTDSVTLDETGINGGRRAVQVTLTVR
jgi:dienelactone hydrolase